MQWILEKYATFVEVKLLQNVKLTALKLSDTSCEFPGYCQDVIEDFALLGCYTVYVGSLPTWTVYIS